VAKKLEIDLIVMASHNKRKFADYVLGPNAEHVVHHAKMSVMIVR
jgi:nucleotide-binding universal stress UspA family protein